MHKGLIYSFFSCVWISAASADRLPIAFTMYSQVDRPVSERECLKELSEAHGMFSAISFNVDYPQWHQGFPEDPLKSHSILSPRYGELYVTPATKEFYESLRSCIGQAIKYGFSPIVLKIKIMDYIRPGNLPVPEHVWRAMIPFDPLKGNYVSESLGPVDLGLQLLHDLRRSESCSECENVILSYSDEYVQSLMSFASSWKKVFESTQLHFKHWKFKTKLAVNLDWSTPWAVNLINRWWVASALNHVDIVGWSLYRPFLSTIQQGVRMEQEHSVRDLRIFLDSLGLRKKPLAIFEFGVNHRLAPSHWDSRLVSRDDQRRAYFSWLKILEEKTSPVEGVFGFWFGELDPRHTIRESLMKYRSARPLPATDGIEQSSFWESQDVL